MLENSLQKEILSLCSFAPNGAKFSELKPKHTTIENDLFNYHLQYLVKNGYLEKRDQLYFLTIQGKSLVTNIDHATKSVATNYKVSVYLCPVVDGKVLLYKRLKHPQYGYSGFISGKITYGETILGTAEREFTEETNLTAKFKVVGNMRQIRHDKDNKVIEDGIFYVCYTDKVNGELLEKSKEGEYFWVRLSEVSKLEKIFKPSLEIGVGEVLERIEGKKSWDSLFFYELQPEPEEY